MNEYDFEYETGEFDLAEIFGFEGWDEDPEEDN